MAAIVFPLSSMPGQNRQEGAGRLVNCYAEPLGKGARWEASRKTVPGLLQFGTTGEEGYRGGIEIPGTFYAAWEEACYRFTSAGGAGTLHDTLSGAAKCFFARNNNSTPEVVAVDPSAGAFQITTGGVVSYPDANVGSPNAVCSQNGYFFFTYGNSVCRSSGINTTAINANDFITAESSPDGLLRPVPFNNQLYLCGLRTIEVWSGNPVNDTGFPYNRVTTIARGLAGRHAVAGFEEGFGKGLIFVGDDNGVHLLTGHAPEKISPPDLDRLIAAVTDKNTLEACVYVDEGRPVWVLSGPGFTWEFNVTSLKWNERSSHLQSRWRGTQSALAFDKWLVGDTESGNLYQVTRAAKNEGGEPLKAICESAPVHQFPANLAIDRIDLDVTVGVGRVTGSDPTQTTPRVEVSVSKYGDENFGIPRLLDLGRQAQTSGRVYATRFGHTKARGAIVRVSWSDEMEDFALMGGDMRGATI